MGQRTPPPGRLPGPRRENPARGARLRPWIARTPVFILLGVLLRVSSSSPVNIRNDRVHEQSSPWQGQKYTPQKIRCLAGFHLSEDSKSCVPCTRGQDYTEHLNTEQSCIPCTVCRSDQKELAPCTTTTNRKCECKNGTFSGENSPEACETCSTRCPDGMIVDGPCTSQSDLKCISRESGNGPSTWIVVAAVLVVAIVIICILVLVYRMWCKTHGTSVNHKCLNKVFFGRLHWCPRKEPGTEDNALNSIVSDRDSLSTVASVQVLEGQQQTKPPGAAVQTPRETEPLLPSTETKKSQKKSRRLVPVNVEEATKSLRQSFDSFSREVPMTSWNQLMRKVGLMENEIQQARSRAVDPGEALYCMLLQWHSIQGREASVNTLLDALEEIKERHAKEEIEKELVSSGMYTYEDEDSALS
ncbi:tumor necrosis factor receptor superfamily member 10A isoform X2 [Talpa occidentalis]|uniref:tumor necrosis factor receptor superfamily member 10A isoform X2 n=1 Tax=Talpa occidentalis TaxID=50954 RepID=UPI001890528F|nr:tumor necrosis factor receptor superfamily member 10A isoform X2 [Talpa occidentalis]